MPNENIESQQENPLSGILLLGGRTKLDLMLMGMKNAAELENFKDLFAGSMDEKRLFDLLKKGGSVLAGIPLEGWIRSEGHTVPFPVKVEDKIVQLILLRFRNAWEKVQKQGKSGRILEVRLIDSGCENTFTEVPETPEIFIGGALVKSEKIWPMITENIASSDEVIKYLECQLAMGASKDELIYLQQQIKDLGNTVNSAIRNEDAEKARRQKQGEKKETRKRFLRKLGKLGAGVIITAELAGIGYILEQQYGIPESIKSLLNRVKPSAEKPQQEAKKEEPLCEKSQQNEVKIETIDREFHGLPLVLLYSPRIFDEDTMTWKDNILNHHAVSESFLGDLFEFAGEEKRKEVLENDKNPYKNERIMRFAVKGSRSGYLDRNGKGADKFKTTQLKDAINNLLDYERLTDEQIAEWICFTYKISFDVDLDKNLIEIFRDSKTKKIKDIKYKGKAGKVWVAAYKLLPEESPDKPGGNATSEGENFPLIKDEKILLHSGINMHDLVVPAKLMKQDKRFNLEIKVGGKSIGSYNIDAMKLGRAIEQELDAAKSSKIIVHEIPEKKAKIATPQIASYIAFNDDLFRNLSDFIVKGKTTPREKTMAIINFVKNTGRRDQYGAKYVRHPLVTLFNEGETCMSTALIWSSLMAAQNMEHSLISDFAFSEPPEPFRITAGHQVVGAPKDFVEIPKGVTPVILHGHVIVDVVNGGYVVDKKNSSKRHFFLGELIQFDENGKAIIKTEDDLKGDK